MYFNMQPIAQRLNGQMYFYVLKLLLFVLETEKAVAALHNRWFGGRNIKAEEYDEGKFAAGDLSG